MKAGVLKYRNSSRIMHGREEFGRLMVSKGPEKGAVFVFESGADGSFVLGRGDHTDLQLLDSKSSRRHAEFFIDDGVMKVRDLHSANGVKVNSILIKSTKELKSGDKIELGSSALKWLYHNEQLDNDISQNFPETKVEGKSVFELEGQRDEASKRNLPMKKKEKPLFSAISSGKIEGPVKVGEESRVAVSKKAGKGGLIAILTILLVYFWIGDSGQKTDSKKKTGKSSVETAKLRSSGGTLFTQEQKRTPAAIEKVESDPTAKVHLHRGLRELRNRNYSRAMGEFTTALAIQPGMPEAMVQLATARKLMVGEMKKLVKLGELERRGGRYPAAANHFCQVMKLLKSDPDGAVDTVRTKSGKTEKGKRFEKVKNMYNETLDRMGKDASEDHCNI